MLGSVQSPDGWGLLHMAAIQRLQPCVELILATNPSVINVKDSWSHRSEFATDHLPYRNVNHATALHYACLAGDMKIAEVLLKAGADWTIKDSSDRTPDQLIYSGYESMKLEFKTLCEEEECRREKIKESPGEGQDLDCFSEPHEVSDEEQADGKKDSKREFFILK